MIAKLDDYVQEKAIVLSIYPAFAINNVKHSLLGKVNINPKPENEIQITRGDIRVKWKG